MVEEIEMTDGTYMYACCRYCGRPCPANGEYTKEELDQFIDSMVCQYDWEVEETKTDIKCTCFNCQAE